MGTTMNDEEMSEIVQETRIDLSVWLRYDCIASVNANANSKK
jgi:hypothetical protein